uniref:Uncharacterized protein n=1 Tax=Capsella bursa-pastoris TaxID=3719 RepID=A0A6H1YJC4_CAPBU|nr:hypothetical protein [Capsella bursa-pastoris]
MPITLSQLLSSMKSGRTGLNLNQDVFPGIPFPAISECDVLNHPFYVAGTVCIPAESCDPLTFASLTRLNHFLVNLRYDFFNGIIDANYIQGLQQELSCTLPEGLREKLDMIFFRELLTATNRVNHWYFQTFGVQNPIDFPAQYEARCFNYYLKMMEIPTPLEEVNSVWILMGILSLAIILILIFFWRFRQKKIRKRE